MTLPVEIFAAVPVAVVIGCGMIFYFRSEYRRSCRMHRGADRLGFGFKVHPGANEAPSRCPLLQVGGKAPMHNVIRGTYRGVHVMLFDYDVKLNHEEHLTVVAFHVRRGLLPSFAIWPRRNRNRKVFEAAIGAREMRMAHAPANFAKMFAVHSPNHRGGVCISRQATEGMAERATTWVVEGGGEWLLVYRLGPRPSANHLKDQLWQAFQVYRPFAGM